jgi:hypothetical protein
VRERGVGWREKIKLNEFVAINFRPFDELVFVADREDT